MGLGWLVSTRVAADVGALVLVKGTLLIGALIAFGALTRGRSAALRNGVWFAGLVGLLAAPAIQVSVPDWGSPAFSYPAETSLIGLEAIESSAPAGARGGSTGAAMAAEPSPAHEEATPPGPLPVISVLLLVWWIGVLYGVVRLTLDLLSVARLRRRSQRVDGGHPVARMIDDERRNLGIRRRVALLVRPERGLAATIGLVRPAIVLGPDVLELPEDRLRPVVLHELAHIRRHDFGTNLLAALALTVYWPNPLFWLAHRQAGLTLEQACDDEVLARGVPAAAYARVLMHFAVTPPSLSPALRNTVGFVRFSPTRERILAILDSGLDRAPVARAHAWVGATLAALVLVPVGSWDALERTPGTGPTAEVAGDLCHSDPEVRVRSARTLGLRDAASWRLELEQLLDDWDAQVRLAAAGALHQLGSRESIPAMARVLERPFDGGRGEHGFVLKLAMKTLGKTDDAAAVPVLEAQLDRPVAPLRRLALEQLASMPSHRAAAVPHLARFAASDPDEHNRTWAAETLRALTSG